MSLKDPLRSASCILNLSIGLVLFLHPAQAQTIPGTGLEWTRLHHAGTGTSFEFPRDVFSLEKEGRRGAVFTTADERAAIRAFAIDNPKRLSPRDYLRQISNPDVAFSYIRATGRFFVASGSQAGTIVYRRCNFSRDLERAGCVQLDYPASEKRAWDSVVTRISLSLRVQR